MTKLKIIIFLIVIIFFKGFAQENSQNYFFPHHETINDSLNRTLTTVGNFFSLGAGLGFNKLSGGFGYNLNYSLTYKSHVFSTSFCQAESFYRGEWSSDYSLYNSTYLGVLYGESYRLKYFITTLSVGIGYSSLFSHIPANKSHNTNAYTYNREGLTLPIELKIYGLVYDGIGMGLFMSRNLTPKNTPFFMSLSVVLGHWNRWKCLSK